MGDAMRNFAKAGMGAMALLAIGMAQPDAQPYAGMPAVPGPTAPANPAERTRPASGTRRQHGFVTVRQLA